MEQFQSNRLSRAAQPTLSQNVVAQPASASQEDINQAELLKEICADLEEMEAEEKRFAASTQPKPKKVPSKGGRSHSKKKRPPPSPSREVCGRFTSKISRPEKSQSSDKDPKVDPPPQPSAPPSSTEQTVTTTTNSKNVSTSLTPITNPPPHNFPMTFAVDPMNFLLHGFDSVMPKLFPNVSPLELTARMSIYKPLFIEFATLQLSQTNSNAISDLVTLFITSLRTLQLL